MQEARWLEATCILLQDSSIDSGEAKGRLKSRLRAKLPAPQDFRREPLRIRHEIVSC